MPMPSPIPVEERYSLLELAAEVDPDMLTSRIGDGTPDIPPGIPPAVPPVPLYPIWGDRPYPCHVLALTLTLLPLPTCTPVSSPISIFPRPLSTSSDAYAYGSLRLAPREALRAKEPKLVEALGGGRSSSWGWEWCCW